MNSIIFAALTVAVSVVGGLVAKALNSLAETNSENALISEIATAASNAVAMVSQTYVDALKEAGSFDEDAQKKALALALAACVDSLSQSAQDYIQKTYGDVSTYLTTMIEAEVRAQKLGSAALEV